jgi:hypothetical protein
VKNFIERKTLIKPHPTKNQKNYLNSIMHDTHLKIPQNTIFGFIGLGVR